MSAFDIARRSLPSTSFPLARAAAGLLAACAAPFGWLMLRWVAGVSPAREIAHMPGLFEYLFGGAAVVGSVAGYMFGRMEVELRRANARLAELALSDELTGLSNQRVFRRELPRLLSLLQRAGLPLALIVLDLDLFKQLNDTHGHAAGDVVLAAVGRALATGRRREDVVARVGGEEFALLLPGVDTEAAKRIAERLIARVRELPMDETGGAKITVSAGVTVARSDDDPGSLFARADRALYAAKHAGRDRWAVG